MKSAQGKRLHLTRFMMIGAVVLMAVAIFAAPVLAQPAATTLTATANAPLLAYGGGTLISAVLMDAAGPVALSGQWVRIEQATSAAGPWELLYLVTTASGDYTTGTYTGAVVPVQNTWYKFVFEGTSAYAPRPSNVLAIQVKPLLGKPGCPSRVTHGKKFTVKGTLKPAFAAGAKTVKVKAFKLKHKKWVAFKTYTATNADYKGYTQYKAGIRIKSTGKYRFKAQAAASVTFALANSVYSRTLTVK